MKKSKPPSPERSFASRHGAALAAGATAFVLLLILACWVPRLPPDSGPPTPGHWFDDRAAMVSTSFAAAKSTYLQSYVLQALHLAVLVVIEPAVPPDGIEQYTTDAAGSWKIGAQGADNGVVLFVFPSARTMRLQVGYGLEGVIPDIEARHLLEATLLPQFTAGKYEDGFNDFLAALVKRLQENAHESVKADKLMGIGTYAMNIIRQVPQLASLGWKMFKREETQGRIVMALFVMILGGAFAEALIEVAIGVGALVQLPWRMVHGKSGVPGGLHLEKIGRGLYVAAGIIVAIALLGLGSEGVMEGHGTFSGAGVTVQWPAAPR